jgi:hypothetical protein
MDRDEARQRFTDAWQAGARQQAALADAMGINRKTLGRYRRTYGLDALARELEDRR